MPTSKPSSTPETLPCAYCDQAIDLGDLVPAEGMEVVCPQCGQECVLEREWTGHGDRCRWLLVENGDDDEP